MEFVDEAGVDYRMKTIRVDERNVAVQLWDTAGQERFRSMTQSYFRKADGVLLLFDVTNERSFVNVREWCDCIGEHRGLDDVPTLLCGTKADLRGSCELEGRSCVDPSHALRLADQLKCQYYETSAKTGAKIADVLVDLVR